MPSSSKPSKESSSPTSASASANRSPPCAAERADSRCGAERILADERAAPLALERPDAAVLVAVPSAEVELAPARRRWFRPRHREAGIPRREPPEATRHSVRQETVVRAAADRDKATRPHIYALCVNSPTRGRSEPSGSIRHTSQTHRSNERRSWNDLSSKAAA
jgi:hypothetical protein